MAIERDPVLTMSGDGRGEMHHEAELWLRMAREFLSLGDAAVAVRLRDLMGEAAAELMQRAARSIVPDRSRTAVAAYFGSPLDALSLPPDKLRAEMLQRGVPVGDAGYDVEVRVTWRPVSTGKDGG